MWTDSINWQTVIKDVILTSGRSNSTFYGRIIRNVVEVSIDQLFMRTIYEACVFSTKSVINHEIILYNLLNCFGIVLLAYLYIFTISIVFYSSTITWVFLQSLPVESDIH